VRGTLLMITHSARPSQRKKLEKQLRKARRLIQDQSKAVQSNEKALTVAQVRGVRRMCVASCSA
jgi:hypothetical protein